jgi:uncharacterized protein YceK
MKLKFTILIALAIGAIALVAGCGTSTTAKAVSQATAVTTTTHKQAAMTSATLVAALKAAGLPVSQITTYDENTDPNSLLGRPNEYIQKTSFADTQVASPSTDNGTIEVFSTAADAQARKAYVDGISKAASFVGYYSYQSGVYLLRVSYDVPPSRAKQYETAFLAALK